MIMPSMSGGETYNLLKKIRSDVKVLLSSGYSVSSEATEILNRGCEGFIQKPFTIHHMSCKIREILDKDYSNSQPNSMEDQDHERRAGI
jgi:DNA-binding NtrC family response regulator